MVKSANSAWFQSSPNHVTKMIVLYIYFAMSFNVTQIDSALENIFHSNTGGANIRCMISVE